MRLYGCFQAKQGFVTYTSAQILVPMKPTERSITIDKANYSVKWLTTLKPQQYLFCDSNFSVNQAIEGLFLAKQSVCVFQFFRIFVSNA